MKHVEYTKDENFVDIEGTIDNLPDYCKYIPRPLVAFDLFSKRKRKSEDEEWKVDHNRIIVFDDEEFHTIFENGERVRIKGEIQSRNFTRDNHPVDDLIKTAVKNYIEIEEGNMPTVTHPKGKKREPLQWEKLMVYGLLPDVPDDSMWKLDGSKQKTQDSPFVYRIDENGDVYKESEHTAYEILAKKIEKVEDECHPLNGDKNKVVLCGKITRRPNFDMVGPSSIPFFQFNVRTISTFFEGQKRVFYNNVISWSTLAEEGFETLQVNDFVRVIGRLQSREYIKKVRKKWTTEHGNNKSKNIELSLTTREISASKIQKCTAVEKKKQG